MNSLFSDLDKLIEQAVKSSTKKEKQIQAAQSKSVDKYGLRKKENKKKDSGDEDDMEEAEGEEDTAEEAPPSPDEKKGSEDAKKITGTEDKTAKVSKDTPGTRTSKKLNDPPEKTLRNPKYPDIAQKINTLRGGSSLKSKPISSSVGEYVKNLSSAEKSALLTYLTNLSQIMAPIKKPSEVKDPSDVGIDVRFKKGQINKKNVKSASASSVEKEKKPKLPDLGGVVVVGED